VIKLTQRHGGTERRENGWGMVGGGWLGIGTKLFKFLLVFECNNGFLLGIFGIICV
jgi:hypothetical protein